MADPKKAAPAAAQESNAALDELELVVARGRCIQDETGIVAKAGDTVRVDRATATRLLQTGHLVDPLADEIKRGEGPEFRSASGPSVNPA